MERIEWNGLDDVYKTLGVGPAQTVMDQVIRSETDDGAGRLTVSYSYDDESAAAPALLSQWIADTEAHDPDVAIGGEDAWVESLCDAMRESVANEYWFAEVEWQLERDLATSCVAGLAETAAHARPGCEVEWSDGVLDDLQQAFRDGAFDVWVDPDVERWLDDEVCVDILLATPEERDADLSRIGYAWHSGWEVGDMAHATELAEESMLRPLAEAYGCGLREMLEGDVEGPAGTVSAELADWPGTTCELCVCARMTLRDWARLRGEVHRGNSLTIETSEHTSVGFFDRMYGGGTMFESLRLPRPFEVPARFVDDLAIDHARDDCLVAGVWGYTVHSIYGATEEMWDPTCKVSAHPDGRAVAATPAQLMEIGRAHV